MLLTITKEVSINPNRNEIVPNAKQSPEMNTLTVFSSAFTAKAPYNSSFSLSGSSINCSKSSQAFLRLKELYRFGRSARTQRIDESTNRTTLQNAKVVSDGSISFLAFRISPIRTPSDARIMLAFCSITCLSCQISENLLQARSSMMSSALSIVPDYLKTLKIASNNQFI